jgi:ribose 5-phosphate isomerase A
MRWSTSEDAPAHARFPRVDATRAKRNAAIEAVTLVEDGMTVGLGTGSTAELFIAGLAGRLAQGLSMRGVATSERTARVAREAGIPLVGLDAALTLDLTIDGADEILADGSAIKGGGGALLREKVVAAATRGPRVAVVDDSKLVTRLGAFPLPVEVVPFARPAVERALVRWGVAPQWRRLDGAPVVTDNGNHLIDVRFGPRAEWDEIAARLDALPGVAAHGLFLDCFDRILLGSEIGVTRREVTRTGPGRFPSL